MSTAPVAPNNLSSEKFKLLLQKAKLLAEQRKEHGTASNISTLQQLTEQEVPQSVDVSNLGLDAASLNKGDELETERAIEVFTEINSAQSQEVAVSAGTKQHNTGVAANVTLNKLQNEFISLALQGEDVCFIGAAGTGKTTATGQFTKKLIADGKLVNLQTGTKWLKSGVPGVLTTSFTRKAVNNIRRAVPQELKPHVLTIHKVLEFAPVFYEIVDPKDLMNIKKTMKFEPQRTRLNPLPPELSLIIYEESSMIGTDLYQLLQEALPHSPQEIFIGDIRQLPPIFGPAILGFKMAILPTVELTEVYRQALQSPIIRLAHAVLSGNSAAFSPKLEFRKEKHPFTGKLLERKVVPSLEAYNEDSEHGLLKIHPWQKRLSSDDALNGIIQQFIAWDKSGYYNADEDVILCPFNKALGTVEINRGIQNYLGRKRQAVVHEIIAGFETHYLAIGDRVLYDKEDAVVLDIQRSGTYLGKPYQPASVGLDRWGCLSEVALSAGTGKGTAGSSSGETMEEDYDTFSEEAVDRFLELTANSPEDEDRVVAASHVVTIRFSYSDETVELRTAGEINSLLGGNALTVHKMQGSEAHTIFIVLHHTHAAMISNELLYTAITRARFKLHIICEPDTFYKGVKMHKVRGQTLLEKIAFFKGKGNFEEMVRQTELAQANRAAKVKRLEEERKQKERSLANQSNNSVDDTRTVPIISSSLPVVDTMERVSDSAVDEGSDEVPGQLEKPAASPEQKPAEAETVLAVTQLTQPSHLDKMALLKQRLAALKSR